MPNCPRCDNEKSIVFHTISLKNGTTKRERVCCQCKLIWFTIEQNDSVSVYNENTMKSENVPIVKYMKELERDNGF